MQFQISICYAQGEAPCVRAARARVNGGIGGWPCAAKMGGWGGGMVSGLASWRWCIVAGRHCYLVARNPVQIMPQIPIATP